MRNVIQPADAAARERLAVAGHALLDPSKPGATGLQGPDTPGGRLPGIRSLIQESWQRSIQLKANPDIPEAPLAMDGEELEEYRSQHPSPPSCRWC